MKKNIIIFLMILMFASLAYTAIAAQTTQRPSEIQDITVTLINQEPDPAEPGKYVDVRFKFDNNGSGEARNVIVELMPEYPFSLDTGVSATRNIGTIQSRQRGDVGVIVKYRLRVDENAVEGENELKIKYKIEGYTWIQPEEFMVDVQTHDAILSVDAVTTDKKTLEPGSSNNVKIKLSNKADSVLKDVKVRLELDSTHFVPLGSTNEKSIYQIPARDDYEFNFKLLVNPEAGSGVYQVPLKIAYSDELGKGYFKNGTIGLIIGAKPDLSITLDTTDIFEPKKAGEVVVKVVNKGVTDIKFMNIRLMPGDDYRILSNEEEYLGNIDSDDYETAEFDIFVEKNKEKKAVLPVVIEYKDANNNDYKETVPLTLNLYSASEAKKLGLVEGNGKVGFFIMILVVVGGLFAYKRWKKGKKKK
ncbi:hypothetical protein CMO93_00220 [Candidatus Woesearchaeota archaeon]|mgnify:CR=1 FL=1|nr:hypothetical protein [Candidatus Woesearchaeota archaeon]|tara:strand:+ start:486 stop:1736 length:1251 start_codon:yes stop_codon:yes gene_type:complete